jgi:SAM-dependent methyltransferase
MSYVYCGTELDLFAAAQNWKSYVRTAVTGYLGPEVLEVGAGNGNTTRALCRREFDRWVCLEPDAALADELYAASGRGELPECCHISVGTLAQLDEHDFYDTILYMDVLEHIADDRGELARAASRLKPGGHLVVLAPAHQWLYTPFDEAIGHYRRYTKRALRDAAPTWLSPVRLVYLDSVGMLASLGNRLLLGSAMPTPKQIGVWDRLMVPCSRVVDPMVGYTVGKSVLGVWRRAR